MYAKIFTYSNDFQSNYMSIAIKYILILQINIWIQAKIVAWLNEKHNLRAFYCIDIRYCRNVEPSILMN